jgi:hypothetical protein
VVNSGPSAYLEMNTDEADPYTLITQFDAISSKEATKRNRGKPAANKR